MKTKLKENKKNKVLILLMIIFLLVNLNLVFAENFYGFESSSFGGRTYNVYGASVNPQFNNPGFLSVSGYTSPEVYWPKFNREDCLERQDFIMQIAPGGCSPAVVRSDLLEEQNVPVFCKVQSIQINPLIDVSRIRSLRFIGDYPKGVSGISYYPAKVGLRSDWYLKNSPVNDNLGYVVIVLSRQEIEGEMPEFIKGNLTAIIDYEAEGAFGIGQTNFYLSEMGDEEWRRNYEDYGFWNGRNYVRADLIESDRAIISVYRDSYQKEATVTLRKGETSNDIYTYGFYCAAGMKLRLEDISAPVDSALLQINDEQIWVSKNDRILDNKCRVIDLNIYKGGGRININCPIENGKIELSLTPGKANFNIEGIEKEFGIGEKIKEESGKGIWIGYLGEDKNNEKFAVLIKEDFSKTEQGFSDKQIYDVVEEIIKNNEIDEVKDEIIKEVINQYKTKIKNTDRSLIEKGIDIAVIKQGEKGFGIVLNNILTAKNKNWDKGNSKEILAKEYYDKAIKNYKDLNELYPNEKRDKKEDSYSAQGLYEAAQLSREFEMNENANEFYNKLIKDYPDSNAASQAIRNKELIRKYDLSSSKTAVSINNEEYFIDLLDFKKPNKDELSAVLMINGREEILEPEEDYVIDKNLGNFIEIKDIKNDFIIIRYYKSNNAKPETKKLDLINDQKVIFENADIELMNINLKEQVKLSIIPKTFGPRTESNFSFKIGIEKRGIRLSPEKTKDMISNLEKNINKWREANKKLGNVIKGLKASCFATSAVLSIKNLIEGFNGKAMARREIMTKQGGWNEFCEEAVNNKEYISIEKCFLDNSAEINKDVEIYSKQIQETNKKIQELQKGKVKRTDILDLQGQVDAKQVESEFEQEFNNFIQTENKTIVLPDKDNTPIILSEIKNWEGLTHEQRREIMTLTNTIKESSNNPVLREMAEKQLSKVVLNAKDYYDYHKAELKAEKESKNYGFSSTQLVGDKVTFADIYSVKKGDRIEGIGDIVSGDKVIRVFIPKRIPGDEVYTANSEIADNYAIIKLVKEKHSSVYNIDKIYSLSGKNSDEITKDVKEYLALKNAVQFKEANKKAYENKMLASERLRVKYFDRAPYKGMPSEIPFDIENGWYVKLTYVLSGFGKPYDESGRAVNFWICNVGENGLIEFKKSADDICRYYNGESIEDLGFPGMSMSESRNLINRAQQAIREAGKQYGNKKINIGRNVFDSGIDFGGEEGRCSDFMSPQDCYSLFNVCDPVICPSSRCDLGGRFRVDNVIQTGIVGSLALCLPNAQEGILVPICLSGVHAGIDGFVSIMNSTQECLKENLETGRNIGICDEIKSIYLCEFFWKQTVPFVNVLIPRLIEHFYSQGVRGGGEYLTVNSAWKNTQDSINYFRNEYAVNSMLAFTQRSSEEVGGEICKNFMSVSFPSSRNLFDTLIEPDSPVQYHAWFSENVLTTATIPATSHYKVYYHIYSGKDQGAYYVIYLKGLPESSQIYLNPTYVVDRGYIARGTQVDEAKDFTAVSGYKELCIDINGQEKCGFKQISTSYALNYLSDKYAEEQIQTGIISSKQCIAGSPSLSNLIQPNLQAGIEETINPEIYNRGIIRVCSTENPGKQILNNGKFDKTNSTYDRWKDVGYCDDETIRCWLDTNSVKNVIKDKQVETDVLEKVDLNILGEVDYWTEESSIEKANYAKNFIKDLKIDKQDNQDIIEGKISKVVKELEDLSDLGYSNKYKAYGIYLLGNLYKKIAEIIIPIKKEKLISGNNSPDFNNIEVKTEINNSKQNTKKEEDNKQETDKFTDDMLKENIIIKIGRSSFFGTSSWTAYKYLDKRWISKDIKFVKSKFSYVNGIKELVKNTKKIKVSEENINVSENYYETLLNVLNKLKKNR